MTDSTLGYGMDHWRMTPAADDLDEWRLQAACRGEDTEIFWAEWNNQVGRQRAKRMCESCPVQSECLQFAIDNNEKSGIWGGLDRRERQCLVRWEGKGMLREEAMNKIKLRART